MSEAKILGIYWYDKVTNREVTRRTGVTHFGDLIQKRRHSLFGHVVRMSSLAPAHMALRLSSDIFMGRRISTGLKRPRGRPRASWINQFRNDVGVSISTSWKRATDRELWRVDTKALAGYVN